MKEFEREKEIDRKINRRKEVTEKIRKECQMCWRDR